MICFIIRHFDQGGFSTVAVKDTKMKMLEIFERVIKKRLLHKGRSTSTYTNIEITICCVLLIDFQLERKDSPGHPVDLNLTLETLGVDEFLLTRVDASQSLSPAHDHVNSMF